MSPQSSRLAILQTTGAVLAAGVADCTLRTAATETPTETPPTGEETPGCGGSTASPNGEGTPEPTAGTTFGFVVQNYLEPEDFEATAELDCGESKRYREAFTGSPDEPTYAMSARFEPFVTGDVGRQDNTNASLTFTPGSDRVPSLNPIPIEVYDISTKRREDCYSSINIRTDRRRVN